eukprot:CAMPEP_0197823892 /NCGR_PEP_ID=MMETSP1437-20131217/1206_1 /TAXON_ID=49252 ORGANISM="Eucampia antarctica, Strain CCMP1452" /NCGR_SAMPLE_ID=MMETSP1437 /ASSEMBLY_ACC=CAM_ASM_001096 /LENGTH=1144 /DNA_ID=CAMNT_0043423285 /DNA_START=99 /DNA_END=3534 /DNA_ORIENTATION=-
MTISSYESPSDGDKENKDAVPYEKLMELDGGASSLSSRLLGFREWLDCHGCKIHSSVCIVNGEATDGTKNAPVLIFGPPPTSSSAVPAQNSATDGRCGMVDAVNDWALYDRTMGCQVRAAKELKKDEVLLKVPRSIFITPDLIAASDAGRVVLACCENLKDNSRFWDAFGNTTDNEKLFLDSVVPKTGTQLLVKILHERKKVESAMLRADKEAKQLESKLGNGNTYEETISSLDFKLAKKGAISTRSVALLFLIHQRFSNCPKPLVVATEKVDVSKLINAANTIRRKSPPIGSPETFGPYARSLPPSVSLPICWKRNELALLAGCIPGIPLLERVAAHTMQLASDFIALLEAGILVRFPHVFPRGLLTWDRWMWAASVHSSRLLPVSCYLNKGETSALEHLRHKDEQFDSPGDVWNELGVMIPLLDMLNHESDSAQVTWLSPEKPNEENDSMDSDSGGSLATDAHCAKVIVHKRVKKGSQIYTNYGIEGNDELMLTYGFAQMCNPSDSVSIGWGVNDCVGKVPPPSDYISVDEMQTSNEADKDKELLIHDSSETTAINSWWTAERLAVLEKESLCDQTFLSLLKKGKKMSAKAFCDGTYHPILLTSIVVGTMPPKLIRKHLKVTNTKDSGQKSSIITRKHQRIIRKYLLFLFTRKFEKLLQNFNNGLKDHFNNVKLWTKASSGGLHFNGTDIIIKEEEEGYISWQSFFDSYAYNVAVEVEKRYFAIGPDSCVLSLYDGFLRSLQASIDGVKSESKFESGVLNQLKDLGFYIAKEDDEECEDDYVDDVVIKKEIEDESKQDGPVATKKSEDSGSKNSKGSSNNSSQKVKQDSSNGGGKGEGKGEGKERNRSRRNRRKGDRPPAIKLHIGNLSYQTLPGELFEYFASRYGRENVLECHIPTERETGKSRGFGFVTMPESAAVQALQSDRPHQVDGRVLKVAESNTAGGSRGIQINPINNVPADRCANCGYRPKYCTCAIPNIPGFNSHPGPGMGMMGGPPPPHEDMYGPPPPGAMVDSYDFGHYGRGPMPDFEMVEEGVEVEVLPGDGHTAEVVLLVTIVEWKILAKVVIMTGSIVITKVGIVVTAEAGHEVIVVEEIETGEIGTDAIETVGEILIGFAMVEDDEAAEARGMIGDRLVTVEAVATV